MTSIVMLLAKLDPMWRAVGALAGALSVGVAVGAVLVGFTDMPQKVEANAIAIAENTRRITESEDGIDKILCILSLPEDVSHIEGLDRCGI